uniref:Wsv270-like protein n=1 Tax=Pasiphaea japonica whispovirus TaxID=2984286 RepID=A0A9C7BRN8_9VIRU|nr:MAG: wsv270-like protein [Pasiphaea japonica whispovirus]
MKKYFAVDCDSPLPTVYCENVDACKRRMFEKVITYIQGMEKTKTSNKNILVGVTWNDVNFGEIENCLKTVLGLLNIKNSFINFGGYILLSGNSGEIISGLGEPRDIDDELHVLSNRPNTTALFKIKNCWWNKNSDLFGVFN